MCHQKNHQFELETIKFIQIEITELAEQTHESEIDIEICIQNYRGDNSERLNEFEL